MEIEVIRALASDKRLAILDWLRDPVSNFPPQRDGDLINDGVCALLIATKLGVSQPTAGVHLKLLTATGMLRATKVKQWTFYRRDEDRIAATKRALQEGW